jgi:peroxiredoxin
MNRRGFASISLATAAGLLLLAGGGSSVNADPRVGQPAPNFTATDSNGKKVSLGDQRGKTVVLEWTNDGCPYVRKHYNAKAMQALQKKWTAQGVVWLSVISSPPGEQGYADGKLANRLTEDRGASPTAVLLDPGQQVARAYRATTTPHMFVITAKGSVAYMGAIDDNPSYSGDPRKAKNFVDRALTEVKAGKPVSNPSTRAYGCAVKYTS